MMNTTLEILAFPQKIPHDLIESQTNRVTLLRRRFSRCQLEVSIEKNGHLRGWVTSGETREVKLKGLPAYLNLKQATQLLNQSYLKFQKEAITALPKGLGGGMKHSRPSATFGSNKAETCEEEALQLVEAIPYDKERRVIREAVEGLLKNDPEKKDLNIREREIGAAGAQALAAALQVNQSLQSLSLLRNQIGAAGAQALGAALQVNQSLQSLNLAGNRLNSVDAQSLRAALEVNQSLQSLNLGYNQIGDVGAQALGGALQVNQSLQSLNLARNQIGAAGAQALGAALQVNQTIQSLNLGYNLIRDTGAQALGKALQVNHTLQMLNLFDNQIGNEGTQTLGAALEVNQSIQSLDLYKNRIGDAGAQALGTALQVNHTLQWLGINEDLIGDEGIITKKRIDTLLQGNKQITILFQQQIIQVQNFLQSHQNEEGILLQNLPQLKELLQKWHTDSKNIIPSLEEILIESRRTNLNDKYREKMEGIITDLTNRLHDLWLEPFERKVAALSNQYVMGKEFSEERNADLGYALYETWLTFLGSDCPNWVEDHIQSLIPFGVLLDIAESGEKKDVTDLTDAHLLFERVLSFKNESKDSLCSLTIQS